MFGTRMLFAAAAKEGARKVKVSTGLVGLVVQPRAKEILQELYARILTEVKVRRKFGLCFTGLCGCVVERPSFDACSHVTTPLIFALSVFFAHIPNLVHQHNGLYTVVPTGDPERLNLPRLRGAHHKLPTRCGQQTRRCECSSSYFLCLCLLACLLAY
jgi:hypothetical protein